MPGGRQLAPLILTDSDRAQLAGVARSESLPHSLVQRARIVMASAEGLTNAAAAARVGVSPTSVSKWRRRYLELGIAGLHDGLRPGRPRSYGDEQVAQVITRALAERPPGGTHWSVRSMSEHTGISRSTVHRWFSLFGIRPHLQRTFRLSSDPFFIEKVRDIVGLYLNPPDHALVLCVDEKSGVQALERSRPGLPMGLGYVEGHAHDCVRHGATTLFAALDVATGRVIAKCQRRHRHQEFLRFLNLVEREIPEELDVHIVLDNYATHKHARVRAWLAGRKRYHLHFTPTYASWLSQVERWFGLVSQRAIKRGSFRSVPELVAGIEEYVEIHNDTAGPFVWMATAQSIIDKVERLSARISGTGH